jgi:hypothetical protein
MNKIYSVSDTVLVDKTLSRRHLPRGLIEVRKQIVGLDETVIEQIVGEPEGIVINYSDGLVACEYSLYEIDSVIPETISSEIISVPKTWFETNSGDDVILRTATETWASTTKTVYILSTQTFQRIPTPPVLTATIIGQAYGDAKSATTFESYASDVTQQKIGGIFFISVTFRNKAITS